MTIIITSIVKVPTFPETFLVQLVMWWPLLPLNNMLQLYILPNIDFSDFTSTGSKAVQKQGEICGSVCWLVGLRKSFKIVIDRFLVMSGVHFGWTLNRLTYNRVIRIVVIVVCVTKIWAAWDLIPHPPLLRKFAAPAYLLLFAINLSWFINQ